MPVWFRAYFSRVWLVGGIRAQSVASRHGSRAPTRWRVPVSPRSCVQTQASLSRGFSLWWASQAGGSEDDWHPGSVLAASRSSLRVPKVPQRSDPLEGSPELYWPGCGRRGTMRMRGECGRPQHRVTRGPRGGQDSVMVTWGLWEGVPRGRRGFFFFGFFSFLFSV